MNKVHFFQVQKFENVALFSEPDALFIFDVNTLYKHRNILANNTFTYETENVFCIWENTLVSETDEVKMNLEFFELEKNGLYSRTSDCFSEKAYSIDTTHCINNPLTVGFRRKESVISVFSDNFKSCIN